MTTLEEIRKKARAKMKGCYVCPDCDGNACSGMIPGYGGMRTGQSFRNNRLSFQKYGLLSHLLSASKNPDTTFYFWKNVIHAHSYRPSQRLCP